VEVAFAHLRHLAQHATGDDDLVALGDGVDHGLVFLLGASSEAGSSQVKDDEHQQDGQHRSDAAEGRIGGARAAGAAWA
jgi:hypothetical protein